jgi:hypothetical protein
MFSISNSSAAPRPINIPATVPFILTTHAPPADADSNKLSSDHIDASGLSFNMACTAETSGTDIGAMVNSGSLCVGPVD